MWRTLSCLVWLCLWHALSDQSHLGSSDVSSAVVSQLVVSTDTVGQPIVWPLNMRNITYCVLQPSSRDSVGRAGVWGRTTPPSEKANMERTRMAVSLAAAEWSTVMDFQLIEVPPSRCLPPWKDISRSPGEEDHTMERVWFAVDHLPSSATGRLGDCPLHRVMVEWVSGLHGSPDPRRWVRNGEVWALLSSPTARLDSNTLRGAKVVLDFELEFELLVSTAIHEFGHALGLKHEWLVNSDIQRDGCFRGSASDSVAGIEGGDLIHGSSRRTSFDPASVMGYVQCGGTNKLSFQLSQRDRGGIQHLYGASSAYGLVVERRHARGPVPTADDEQRDVGGNDHAWVGVGSGGGRAGSKGSLSFVTAPHVGSGSMSVHILIDGARLDEMSADANSSYDANEAACPTVTAAGRVYDGNAVVIPNINADSAAFDLLRTRGQGKIGAYTTCCESCRCAAVEVHMEIWWNSGKGSRTDVDRDSVEAVVLMCSVNSLPLTPVHVAMASSLGQHPYDVRIVQGSVVIHAILEPGSLIQSQSPISPVHEEHLSKTSMYTWGVTILPEGIPLDAAGVSVLEVDVFSSIVRKLSKPKRFGDGDVCKSQEGDAALDIEGEGLTDDGLTDFLNATLSVSVECAERVARVNMDRNQLTALPRVLFNTFKNLRYLSANFNRIKTLSIPAGTGLHLQKLLVRGNSISAVDRSVMDHPVITTIDLGENQLQHLDRMPPQTRVLKIDSNQLRRLPRANGASLVDSASNSRTITGDTTGDTGVDSELCSLRLLDASFNLIASGTSALLATCSDSLERIDMSGNVVASCNITSLEFPKLLSLNLEKNYLSEVHIDFERVPRLSLLDLSDNQLTTGLKISSANGCVNRLTHLDLSNNAIASLDSNVLRPSLLSLSVRANRLESLGGHNGSLPLVESLDVSGNMFSSVPHEIAATTRLKHVDISDNSISEFPLWFDAVAPTLESLLCSRNRLQSLPERMERYANIRTVHASENVITTIPTCLINGELPHLQRVLLRSNLIRHVSGTPNDFDFFVGTDVVDLSHNKLSSGPSRLRVVTTAPISYLDLSFNQLEDLSVTLPTHYDVKEFSVSHNQLRRLVSYLDGITVINVLDASHNELNENGIISNFGAREIDLSYNRIQGRNASMDYWDLHGTGSELDVLLSGRGVKINLAGNPISLFDVAPSNFGSTTAIVKSLDLRDCPVDMRSVDGLRELWHLETLHLGGTNMPYQWARTLAGDELRQLLWDNYELTNVGLVSGVTLPIVVANSKTLETLTISRDFRDYSNVQPFSLGSVRPKWPALRAISVSFCTIDIPSWLFELPSLERLEFQGSTVHIGDFQSTQVVNVKELLIESTSINRGRGIPPRVSRAMKKLETLRLSHLDDIVPSHGRLDLPQLRTLLVSGFPPHYGPTTDYSEVNVSTPRLSHVRLRDDRLTEVPKFVQASPVKRLDLRDSTSLSRIPVLPQLTHLNVAKTSVVWEPSIGTWPDLKLLDVSHTRVAGDITVPTTLERLRISNSSVTSVTNLEALSSLRSLLAWETSLREVPTDLSHIRNLTDITLSSTSVGGTPPRLPESTQVALLVDCNFTSPPAPLYPHQLIEMSGNPIRSLEGISLCNLLQLDPHTNGFQAGTTARLTLTPISGWPPIPPMECRQYSVKTLIMARNKLEYIPWSSFSTSGIRSWDLSNNKIATIDDLSTSMKGSRSRIRTLVELDLSGNNITRLASLAAHAPRLQHVNLFNNSIGGVVQLSKICRSLRALNMSRNDVTGLSGMQGCRNLRTLDLSHNGLASLPDDLLKDMRHLSVLDFSHNQLVQLPELLGVTSLRQLDVSNNRLSAFSGLWLRVRYDKLNLSHNKLTALDIASVHAVDGVIQDNLLVRDNFNPLDVAWFMLQALRAPLQPSEIFQKQQKIILDLMFPLAQGAARLLLNFRASVEVFLLPHRGAVNVSTEADMVASIDIVRASHRPLVHYECLQTRQAHLRLLSVGGHTFDSWHASGSAEPFEKVHACFPRFPTELLMNATRSPDSVFVWEVGNVIIACIKNGDERRSVCSSSPRETVFQCCERLIAFKRVTASNTIEVGQVEETLPTLLWVMDGTILYNVGQSVRFSKSTWSNKYRLGREHEKKWGVWSGEWGVGSGEWGVGSGE